MRFGENHEVEEESGARRYRIARPLCARIDGTVVSCPQARIIEVVEMKEY